MTRPPKTAADTPAGKAAAATAPSSPVSVAAPLLEFEGIEKRFGSVRVLRDVRFSLPAGCTLGLVGENGAGKSTLMNILGGNLRPDAGHMRLDGRPYAPRNPLDAARHGVAFIHQELNLFPNLSVAENLFLTDFPRLGRWPFIDRRAARQRATALLEQVGLGQLPPETPVEKLSAGERQLVEIAKALEGEARLILFDEPTTSLTARETERLFALLARLQAEGRTLIYISHQLDDVLRLCHRIVVLRDGEVVGQGPTPEFTPDRLVSLMVGRSLTQMFPARVAAPRDEVVLEVNGVTQPGFVRDIRFRLHRGEILGLAGLMGAGRSELARLLFGLEPCQRGEIRVNGQPLRPAPRRCIRQGIALLTENRREDGLCLEASIADNIVLATLPAHRRGRVGWLDTAGLRAAVNRIRQAVGLTPTATNDQPVRTLSGGNQQKVLLARWLLARPGVFILDEPTRGIDVGAKHDIYCLIHELAANGAGVLLISSELEELTGLCDRILVMSRGEIVDELHRAEFDRERILRAALGAGRPEAPNDRVKTEATQ
ncbi:MAG: sugar ABC transporter ATP-binding protein [Verrucomicrobiales bacterium]|nr:sugar ABC transporter ATP-binding protein [Verrucomicrobiales bacterium]